MTCSTSEVAVCCSSASDRSRCAPQLVEQARVLDRDDGLVGEVLDQLDLLVSERPDLLAVMAIAPISSFSLSIGTARERAKPPRSTGRRSGSPSR